MTYLLPDDLNGIIASQDNHVLFATVSGAHLYGFPSMDSDVDIRGAHRLPLTQVLGLKPLQETTTTMSDQGGVELDLVTHDIAKFCRLMLGRNGYVAEQVSSPLIVATSDVHRELKAALPACLTRHHANHYLGFARTQWKQFGSGNELKPLLYTFRVLATGLHLMRTGEIEANLNHMPDLVPSYVPELIAAKQAGEHGLMPVDGPGPEQLRIDVDAMTSRLEAAGLASRLPDRPSAMDTLHDLVVRTRLADR